MPDLPADLQDVAPPTGAPFYVTTPIYYVNARPHIGHSYTTLVADTVARRARLLGRPTFFLTGTDEHGQKIERSAAAAGIPPQQFADQVSASFRALWDRMGITYTDFIRTTEPRHTQGVQHLFRELQRNNAIYKGTYTGQYCVSDEAYVDGPPGIHCPDCGRLTETVSESNYYFRLSSFQRPLLDLIESNTLRIQPDSRRNEVLSFLRGPISSTSDLSSRPERSEVERPASPGPQTPVISTEAQRSGETPVFAPAEGPDAASTTKTASSNSAGSPTLPRTAAGTPYLPGALKDLSISRTSFRWGIPVPNDPDHVIYVWLDALANYMTALGYGQPEHPGAAPSLFDQFWPADLHLVGKEIIRFHCVYWPAFLLALDPDWATHTATPPGAPTHASQDASQYASQDLPHNAVISTEAQRSGEPPVFAPAHAPEGQPTSIANTSPLAVILSEAEGSPSAPAHAAGNPLAFDPAWAAHMLPRSVVAHGWLLFEESKMSKSRGNIVRTETILDGFGDHFRRELVRLGQPEPSKADADLFATDVLRYFLLREIPFGQDGSFSFDAMITRYNADLANGYGNLVSRVLAMIEKNLSSTVPHTEVAHHHGFTRDEAATLLVPGTEAGLYARVSTAVTAKTWSDSLAAHEYARAIDAITTGIGIADAYITQKAPWKLAKADTPEARIELMAVLYTAAESIRILTALLYPILPFSTARVWAQLGLGDIEQAAARGDLQNLQWGGLTPGTRLGPLAPIFPRAPKELAQTMADTEATNSKPADLTSVANAAHDASSTGRSEFHAAPLTSTPASVIDEAVAAEVAAEPSGTFAPPSTAPGAPLRSTSDPVNPLAEVGGSAATIPARPETPSHVEAEPSGIFAGAAAASAARPSDASPQITIDDFAKVELRIAEVLTCDRVPKADKLLRLEVDLGHERRQILSGIAEWYAPEDLVGRRIIVVTNLAPRKMRGLDSHGMLLAASGAAEGEAGQGSPSGGKPILATVPEGVPVGTRLK